MPKCEYCGKEVDLPFECKFCGGYFCVEHRLPENHNCPCQPPRTPLGHWKAKKAPMVRTEKIFPSPSPITEEKTRKGRNLGKVVITLLAVMVIGALLWYSPTIISYFQTPTDSSDEYSYINMTLRDLPLSETNATIIEFGDTEYSFRYLGGYLTVEAPFQSKFYIPTEGKIYNDLGIEIKVSKVGSDYISNYIVILVKPTIQNYMASLHFTKVNITLNETKAVNISSGLINKTNQYWFSYTQIAYPTFNEPQLTIRTSSQSKSYVVIAGFTIREFEIETKVYKIRPEYMVIYVKPLY